MRLLEKINVPVGFYSPVLPSLSVLTFSLPHSPTLSLPPFLPSLSHPSIPPHLSLKKRERKLTEERGRGKDQGGGGLYVNIPYVQIKNIKKGKLLCKKKTMQS